MKNGIENVVVAPLTMKTFQDDKISKKKKRAFEFSLLVRSAVQRGLRVALFVGPSWA